MTATGGRDMVQFSASIDENGQLTLPEGLRERLGLSEGDTLVFEPRGQRIVARKAPKSGDVYGELAGGSLGDSATWESPPQTFAWPWGGPRTGRNSSFEPSQNPACGFPAPGPQVALTVPLQ